MNLLITGGAGFIGTNFVKRQLKHNPLRISKIVVLDKLTYSGSVENFSQDERRLFEFVEGDICNSVLMSRLVKGADFIVNFAAESHVDRSISNATEFVQTNIVGTQVLLDSCRKNGIEKFLQVSTDEVYGSIDAGSWTEDYPLLPNSPYSASKAGADLLVRAYGNTFGFHTNITRCSNNYGPYQFPEKVIPLFVTNLILGGKLPIYGNGANIRDWLHVEDHCRGIELVLQGGKKGDIYNIGGGTELNNLQLAQKILTILGSDESQLEFVADRLGHDLRYSVNIDKIKSELGFSPRIDFEDGLKKTVDFYTENRLWWSSKR
jgi:dTDP-glucose 4,6-dehydratase